MKEIGLLITRKRYKLGFDHKYRVFVKTGIMIKPTPLITEYLVYMLFSSMMARVHNFKSECR